VTVRIPLLPEFCADTATGLSVVEVDRYPAR
jgi:hypothetical protein